MNGADLWVSPAGDTQIIKTHNSDIFRDIQASLLTDLQNHDRHNVIADKDTVGIRLAETIGARFLSSGLILRAAEKQDQDLLKEMSAGMLADTNKFRAIVLPYLARPDLKDFPLVLSSVGRWEGEEYDVITAANDAGHPIKGAILLNVSEAEVKKRWEDARIIQDRGQREDDRERKVLDTRIEEFISKTMPVIETYRKRGLLIPVTAHGTKDEVFANTMNAILQHIENLKH